MRAVAIVLLLVLAGTARAEEDPELAEAKRYEAALDYEPALVIVERVITHGKADREQLVALHMYAGKLAAGLDRGVVAEDHFARALALAPATSLAEGTSPKILGPFDSARTRAVPLRVTGSVDRGVAVITAEADPLKLVAGIAVKLVSGSSQMPLVVREPQGRRLELPDGARATELSALDSFGNQLWSQRVTETVPPPPITQPSPAFYKRPLLWGSLCLVSGTLAVVAAWQFTRAQDEWNQLDDGMHDYSQLHAVEVRGRRWGTTANVGFGVAAITGLVTTWLVLRHQPSAGSIAVLAGPNRLGLAIDF